MRLLNRPAQSNRLRRPFRRGRARLVIVALFLAGACAHTQQETARESSDADFTATRDPQPLGTYSFMVPIEDDWETEWPDSAPVKREASPGPSSATRTTGTTAPSAEPTPSARGTTGVKRAASAEPLDVPKGMVVVYDEALNDEGWIDSGANRQHTAPASSSTGPSSTTATSSTTTTTPASTLAESEAAPGAAHVVRRRERAGSGDTVAAVDRTAGPQRSGARQANASDPFARLQRDLRAAGVEEESPRTAQQAPPAESLWTRSRESRLPDRPGDDKRMAPGRDPGTIGVHAVAGAGVLIARDPQGGHGALFAYGLNVGWNPDFAQQVAFDLGFWRAGANAGTEMVSAGTSYHHFTARALWQPPLPNNVFLGVGGGVLLTQSIVGYKVGGASADTVLALAHRPGLEATLVAGTRFRPLEVRVEMRTLLRGGMRLDFLPTLSIGATF